MPGGFVLDASIALSWCFPDETTTYGQAVLDALSDSHAEAPALWLFEILNVLTVGERRKRIQSSAANEFLEKLAHLDIRVEQAPPVADSNRLLRLVRRHGLTAYDAAYLELAMRRNLPLATLDSELCKAARAENIWLL